MENSDKSKKINRRDFLNSSVRISLGIALGGTVGYLLSNSSTEDLVWQIDMNKCIQCGKCVDSCVLTPSAVKCVHVFDMCGYCDLCGGYFRADAKNLNTGAENQLCPTQAIQRNFVEDPFFEYHIIEDLCIGCGKCVAGCSAFGNGSLQLQVNHNICVNCNQCAIARVCPTEAFKRVPASKQSLLRGFSG